MCMWNLKFFRKYNEESLVSPSCPKTNLNSLENPISIPKKAPTWVVQTRSQWVVLSTIVQPPYLAHIGGSLLICILSQTRYLGSKEHGVLSLSLSSYLGSCPDSIPTCPNSEWWIVVCSNIGTVVSFCVYNEI